PQDQADTAAIAAELGYLPLALDQAAAYISHARITPGGYLARLREHPARMYAAQAAGGDAQRAIARIWDISLQAITAQVPGAERLLQVLACYAPDNFPREIAGGADPGPDLDGQLGLLASYSLITLTPDTVSMHRLVQAVTLIMPASPGAGDSESPADTALDWLNQALPQDPDTNLAAWPLLRALSPHADALAARYQQGAEPALLGRACGQMGLFHNSQGDYQRALRLRQSALRIIETALGPDHPDTAICLGNLARTYCELGRPADALPLEQRALAITEAFLGPDHPETAIRLNNLAATHTALGRPADALPLFERALHITEATLGPDHPSTAVRLNNLAFTYSDLGRLADALPLEERALNITETALGPSHPDTAVRLGNLAMTYSDLGRLADALLLAERALHITETTLGPDHPDTATCLGNLARTYSELGRPADALPLEQRALAITEAALGPSHPSTALRLGNLAATYRDLGRPADAQPLEDRATRIRSAGKDQGPGQPAAPRARDVARTSPPAHSPRVSNKPGNQ
ncbi:MAG TPA: tetratricopeptide repeat protein, partial [Streptosporangiaceae bacterium]|nr:tetratricopeptide repeat protein [Streptosporangiaceae bacterium]